MDSGVELMRNRHDKLVFEERKMTCVVVMWTLGRVGARGQDGRRAERRREKARAETTKETHLCKLSGQPSMFGIVEREVVCCREGCWGEVWCEAAKTGPNCNERERRGRERKEGAKVSFVRSLPFLLPPPSQHSTSDREGNTSYSHPLVPSDTVISLSCSLLGFETSLLNGSKALSGFDLFELLGRYRLWRTPEASQRESTEIGRDICE